MKLVSFLTLVPIVHSFAPLRLQQYVNDCKTLSYSNEIMKYHQAFHQHKDTNTVRMQFGDDIEEELFEAEEAAAYDAADISDSGMEAAVMQKAVMMAYDLMRKKKLELKDKVEDAKAAEQQFIMIEQATEDLLTQYNEDPSKFKEYHSSKDRGQVAIEMLESVITDAAQKMVDIENSRDMVISQFYEVLEEEHIAEAKAAKRDEEEKAANARVVFIEEFDDSYEIEERRRDMAVSHAAQEAAENEDTIARDASKKKNELTDEEAKLEKQLAEHKRNEDILKADLREIQEIVRDELLKEWEQQQQQQQQGMM
jgi:hypothetical protein